MTSRHRDSELGAAPAPGAAPSTVLSCLVATTPWSGSWLLCEGLRATGVMGVPEDYFNPPTVVPRSRAWDLLGSPDGQFPARYLTAVRAAATGDNGVCGANVPWSHLRWLVRMARAAAPPDSAAATASDADVVAAWFPHTRYLHLRCADTARQALRWYDALHGDPGSAVLAAMSEGDGSLDVQEVRWLETLIDDHERGWQTYFEVHGIDAEPVEYEEFVARPLGTVAAVLDWLGLPARSPVAWNPGQAEQSDGAEDDRLARYRERRHELSATVGVRSDAG